MLFNSLLMFKLFGVSDDEENEIKNLDEEIYDGDFKEDLGQVALDIIETKDSLLIIAPIAGIDLKDVDISIKKNILTISGTRKKPEIYYNGNILRNSECFWGDFSRNIILPKSIDFDEINANIENSILIINLPKNEGNNQNIKINRVIS